MFFFLLRSVGRRDLSAGPEQKKKKTPPRVFFFAPAPDGARAKKKHHPGCLFFAAAPRGRSLTHCGPGWRCLPLGGVVFFFAAAPPGPGWCFFFCCGPARTLTHSRWAGAISARPGWCFFFCCGPRRVFLDNNKKCLGYYIGSKKTRRGHSKKKNTTSALNQEPQAPKPDKDPTTSPKKNQQVLITTLNPKP